MSAPTLQYPPELLFLICAHVYYSSLPPAEPSLDPLILKDYGTPTGLPSAIPASHWAEPVARRALANLCLVNRAWYEAAKPWLWTKLALLHIAILIVPDRSQGLKYAYLVAGCPLLKRLLGIMTKKKPKRSWATLCKPRRKQPYLRPILRCSTMETGRSFGSKIFSRPGALTPAFLSSCFPRSHPATQVQDGSDPRARVLPAGNSCVRSMMLSERP